MKEIVKAALGLDVPKKMEGQSRLKIENALFRGMITNLPGILYVIDEQRRLMWWSKSVEVISGYSEKDLDQLSALEFFHSSEKPKIESAIDEVFAEGSAEVLSYIITKDSRQIPLHFKARRAEINKTPYLVGLGVEVSADTLLQEDSQQKWTLLQTFADQSDTVITVKDREGKYLLVNQKFKSVYELGNINPIGKDDFALFEPSFASRCRQVDLKVIRNKQPEEFEECVDTTSGKRYFLTKKFPIVGITGLDDVVCGFSTDITHIKEREQRARLQQEAISYLATNQELDRTDLDTQLRTIAKKSAETLSVDRVNIWLLEEDTLRCICSYDSGEFNLIQGYTLEQKESPRYFNEVKNSRITAIDDAQSDPRSRELNDRYLVPRNIHSLLDASVYMSGSVTAMVCNESVGVKREWKRDEKIFAGAVADQIARVLAIEGRKRKEEEIHDSLKEKEILLAEIHHRVKNNLAVMSSMLQLQALEEESDEIKSKLLDSVVRIKSMATIHEQMYQSQNFSRMDFSENIRKLVDNIIEIHRPTAQIHVDYRLDDIQLNLNQAIPCSLIINEVITNILKHAFQGMAEGRIRIELTGQKGTIDLAIYDDGVGFPKEMKDKKTNSLGLVLINVLSKQLDAEHHYSSSEDGSVFTLRFKKSKMKGISSFAKHSNQ